MLSQKNAAAPRSARRRIFKRNFGTVFLVVLIFYYNGLLRRHYLTRQGIVPPGLSPWTHLLLNADNGSILEITGFNRPTFMLLVQCLKNTGETPGRRKRGRPPSLDFVGQVGLILLFYNSNLKSKHICLIFGIVPSVCNRYINKMLKRVIQKLRKNVHARIKKCVNAPGSSDSGNLLCVTSLRLLTGVQFLQDLR